PDYYAGRDGEKISALMHIHWTEEAEGDIDSIESYLEGEKLDNETIKSIINPIILARYSLKKPTRSGRKVPEINHPDIREILHKKYRIIYVLSDEEPKKIHILNVIHGRQDIQPFLSQIWQRFLK